MKRHLTSFLLILTWATIATIASVLVPGCGTIKSVMGADQQDGDRNPIKNPFADYNPATSGNGGGNTMIFRTKRGDNAVEVEVPKGANSDFVIPIGNGAKMSSSTRAPASVSSDGENAPDASAVASPIDNTYSSRDATPTDKEIIRTFPQAAAEDDAKRQEIEGDLGLVRADDSSPERQKSYLGGVDKIKQLYRFGRYEAALLELDGMIRDYPTNPKLYAMRGTLLDRLGKTDLAIKSWKQALKFDPKNDSLRRYIERKEQKRSLASQ